MVKIPSSLTWLLKRRARLLGLKQQIDKKIPDRIAALRTDLSDAYEVVSKLEYQLRKAEQELPLRLSTVIADLAAIDRTIRQYNPDISPDEIKAIHTQESPWILGHGEFTKFILASFRLSETKNLTTTDLAVHVLVQSGLNISHEDFPEFRLRVRKRLRRLVIEGKVIRLRDGHKGLDALWRLPSPAGSFTQQVQTT